MLSGAVAQMNLPSTDRLASGGDLLLSVPSPAATAFPARSRQVCSASALRVQTPP
jgi:hypothetical protein